MAKYKEFQANMKRKHNTKMVAILCVLAMILVVTIALAYVASRMLTGKPMFDEKPQISAATPIGTSDSTGGAASGADSQPQTDAGVTTLETTPRYWNTLGLVGQTVDNITIAQDSRMLALPANGRVDYEYFRTALFIGDSLTQGFGIYPPLQDIATVAGFKGIGPREIVQNNVGQLQTGESVATWDYIAQQTPMNIYIGIGTNALVALAEDDAFLKYYGDMLDMLRAQFPNIPIYVQSITPVTQATSDARPLMSNDRIRLLNNALAVMAVEKNMYYVNLHEVLADETGCLRADIASSKDGYHMKDSTGYQIWTDYLATHTAYNPYNVAFLTEPYNA